MRNAKKSQVYQHATNKNVYVYNTFNSALISNILHCTHFSSCLHLYIQSLIHPHYRCSQAHIVNKKRKMLDIKLFTFSLVIHYVCGQFGFAHYVSNKKAKICHCHSEFVVSLSSIKYILFKNRKSPSKTHTNVKLNPRLFWHCMIYVSPKSRTYVQPKYGCFITVYYSNTYCTTS